MRSRLTLFFRLLRTSLVLAGTLSLLSRAAVMPARAAGKTSGVTTIVVAGTQDVGTIDGVPYRRTFGTVSGTIAPDEAVVGLASLPKDASGEYDYTSQFEIIAPTATGTNSAILVEAENRGTPLVLDDVNALAIHGPPSAAPYPIGLGNGFLEKHHLSYARVQWETHIAAGVPASAQGVGEVIVRDFARVLAGDRSRMSGASSLDAGRYATLLLGGISQSGWFVDTFIAEGFNADPISGGAVFAGAIAIDGTGNWLALNSLASASGAAQAPYVVANGAPIAARELLHRPKSDPFYIDVANYTDFFRVRASLTDTASLPTNMRRYDWPGPHHPVTSSKDAVATFAPGRPGGPCNDGGAVPLNPIAYYPYLRTLLVELENRVSTHPQPSVPALPASTLFRLVPVLPNAAGFNSLPGASLQIPAIDANAQPIGGVRFPEVDVPVGKPIPVSLPPVITSAITGICGNIGGWEPLSAADLATRYGSEAAYTNRYDHALDRLIATGYLLASEKQAMLATAAARYRNPNGY